MTETAELATPPAPIRAREFDGPALQHAPFPLYPRLRDHNPLFQDRWIISRV